MASPAAGRDDASWRRSLGALDSVRHFASSEILRWRAASSRRGRGREVDLASADTRPRHNPLLVREEMDAVDSLDYKPIDNEPLRGAILHKIEILGHINAKKTVAKWVIYCLLGVFMGLLTWGLRWGVSHLQALKLGAVAYFADRDDLAGAFAAHFLVNFGYVLLATLMVVVCRGTTAGSGISEVKGYLNGARVPHAVNFATLVGKVVSILFAFSSCLAVGPEGPVVHIGAIAGAILVGRSRLVAALFPGIFKELRNDADQREVIASGTAAGITAAFGAPIGGVLFALEEASSQWRRELTWRTFFSCMLSAFTVAALQLVLEGGTHFRDFGLLRFGLSSEYLYGLPELVPFCLLGVVGGLLGAAFVKLNTKLNHVRRDAIVLVHWKVLEVLLIAVVTAVLVFCVPQLFACEDVSAIHFKPALCPTPVDNATLPIPLFCGAGRYNPMANLMLAPAEDTLRRLFSRTTEMFGWAPLLVQLAAYFALVTLTAGAHVAAGLFVPMMLVGAVFGRLTGQLVAALFPGAASSIDPSIYALVGSTAMMSGFSRLTISLCVIMVELTETTQYLLPLMLAVMFAKWVGDMLSPSVYEEGLDLKNIPFLHHHPPRVTMVASVEHFMAKHAVCLKQHESLDRIYEVLCSTTHNGFPVVAFDAAAPLQRRQRALGGGASVAHQSKNRKRFVGFILRKQLLILLNEQQWVTHSGRRGLGLTGDLRRERRRRRGPAAEEGEEEEGEDYEDEEEGEEGEEEEEDEEEEDDDDEEASDASQLAPEWSDRVLQGVTAEFEAHEMLSNDQFLRLMTRRPPTVAQLRLPSVRVRRRLWLHLSAYMDRSHVTFRTAFSFAEAFRLFCALGQRHVTVVDADNRVVGILTRHDMLKWRWTAQ